MAIERKHNILIINNFFLDKRNKTLYIRNLKFNEISSLQYGESEASFD